MPQLPERPDLPAAPLRAAAEFAETGHAAWLGGEELALHWWAPPGPGPRSHRILTSAPAAVVLERFPAAVPTQNSVCLLPSQDGPIDWIVDQPLPSALADFGFSLHAVAWDPKTDRAVDPYGGLDDIRSGLLRSPHEPTRLFERVPLLALRALRLVAEFGLAVDAKLEKALGSAPLRATAALRVAGRGEITRMLCGPHAGTALALAASSGLLKNLAPVSSANPDVSRWIDLLPRRAELRLAIWLGADAGAWLRSWRFGISRSSRLLELARHHPIDQTVSSQRDTSVGRLLQRLSPEDRGDLVTAREIELASGTLPPELVRRGRAALDALVEAIERVEQKRERAAVRAGLALTGAQVMQQLGCGPGPRVGRALAHLAAIAAADPSANSESQLRAALDAWDTESPGDV